MSEKLISAKSDRTGYDRLQLWQMKINVEDLSGSCEPASIERVGSARRHSNPRAEFPLELSVAPVSVSFSQARQWLAPSRSDTLIIIMPRPPRFTSSVRAFTSTSSSWKGPRRNRQQLAVTPGTDVVGPPDPVSNLRPIRYGSAFDVESITPDSQNDSDKRKAHPYSLAEFSSPVLVTDESGLGRHPFLSSIAGILRLRHVPHSWYYRELLQRLEVAEMQDRLRRVHSDAFHQRFWRDNNARFERDLHNFQVNPPVPQAQLSHQEVPAIESSTSDSVPPPADSQVASPLEHQQVVSGSGVSASPDKRPVQPLSVFYEAWLGANTTRHRAYNRALLQDLLSNLRPAWDYAWLRIWARSVKQLERILGWGP